MKLTDANSGEPIFVAASAVNAAKGNYPSVGQTMVFTSDSGLGVIQVTESAEEVERMRKEEQNAGNSK